MPDEPIQDTQAKQKIVVDTDWKAQVEAEKEAFARLAEQEATKQSASGRPSLPPASFPILVSTLSTQALFAMGHLQDPHQGEVQRDLGQAKHLIDLLQVIEEKTRGNLTADEQRMLDNVLHELRMAYVASRPGAVSQDAPSNS